MTQIVYVKWMKAIQSINDKDNFIRTNTFMFIYKLLTKKKQRALILKEINDFSDSLKNISHSDFCNGEMIGLTINLLNNIAIQ